MDNLNNDFLPNDKNSNENYFGFEDDNSITSEEAVTTDELKSKVINDNKKTGKAKGKKNKGNGGLKKTIAFVSGGLVCAILGGVVGGGSVAYIYKDKISSRTNIINHSTQFADDEGALTTAQAVQKVAPAVVGVSTKSIVSNRK